MSLGLPHSKNSHSKSNHSGRMDKEKTDWKIEKGKPCFGWGWAAEGGGGGGVLCSGLL